jgi:hypothetical protein
LSLQRSSASLEDTDSSLAENSVGGGVEGVPPG